MGIEVKHGDKIKLVHQLCHRTEGCSLREASDAIGMGLNAAGRYFLTLTDRGQIVKSGVHGKFRYFASKDDAAAHDVAAKQAHALQLKESTEKRKKLAAQREREKRARQREEKGLPPYEPPKPKPPKQPKPKRVSTDKKPSGITLGGHDAKKLHQKAHIVWPDHVKIQKAPTPKDDRFTFTPPSKDWRGVISQDWEQRMVG